MITALAFVPRGAAKSAPVRDEPDALEIEQLKQQALKDPSALAGSDDSADMSASDDEGWETDEEADAVAHARSVAASMTDAGPAQPAPGLESAFQKLDMDNYDDDDEDNHLIARLLQGTKFEHEGEDPYITLPQDDAEIEDDTVKASDLLILAAKTEEDSATLEVWLFEEPGEDGEMNAYVHHDIMLPAFPLSVAWMSFNPSNPSSSGNFAAISTFDPEIEIWDLDVIDAMQPVTVLGGRLDNGVAAPKKKSSKNKKKRKSEFRPGSHTDSVLSLAWNRDFQNVLASGSADNSIKVWDLATQQCEHTLAVHKDKVQALAWNPAEARYLLSGGFDRKACVCDMRAPDAGAPSWSLSSDVEAVAWNPHAPTQFAVSSEDGHVLVFDSRSGAGSAPLFTLAAHDKAATSVSFNATIPNLMVTGSVDKTVKLWSIADNAPRLKASEDLGVGAVFSVGVPADSANLVAAGGAKGVVAVWDLLYKPELRKTYGKYFRKKT